MGVIIIAPRPLETEQASENLELNVQKTTQQTRPDNTIGKKERTSSGNPALHIISTSNDPLLR